MQVCWDLNDISALCPMHNKTKPPRWWCSALSSQRKVISFSLCLFSAARQDLFWIWFHSPAQRIMRRELSFCVCFSFNNLVYSLNPSKCPKHVHCPKLCLWACSFLLMMLNLGSPCHWAADSSKQRWKNVSKGLILCSSSPECFWMRHCFGWMNVWPDVRNVSHWCFGRCPLSCRTAMAAMLKWAGRAGWCGLNVAVISK